MVVAMWDQGWNFCDMNSYQTWLWPCGIKGGNSFDVL